MQPRLTEGPVGPTLFRLSVPMFWGLLAIIIVMAAEAFYIAQLGENQLTAISFTFPVLMVLENLALGIGIGASSVVARTIGRGAGAEAQQYVLGSLILAVVVCGALAVGVWLCLEPLFRLLGAGPEVLPLIRDYMAVALPATVMTALPIVGNSCLRGVGETRFAGYNMAVISVLSMGLLPLFIFGGGPVPAMGLQGAAWSTLVTESLSALIAFYALAARENLLRWCHMGVRTLWQTWRAVLHVGMPASINSFIPALSGAFTTALLAAEDPLAVAGYGVATRLENFAVVVFWALSSVIGPMAGQNLGAGLPERVAATRLLAFRFCLVWGLCSAGILILAARPLAGVFSDSSGVTDVTVLYLWWLPVSYGLWGVVMMANGLFNGTGQPRPTLWLTVMRQGILYVPLALAGQALAGIAGIFAATALANILTGLWAWRWSGQRLIPASGPGAAAEAVMTGPSVPVAVLPAPPALQDRSTALSESLVQDRSAVLPASPVLQGRPTA
jgi:putative MATE family efflux protein